MRIRKQLIINMVFFGIAFLIIASSIIITNQAIEQIDNQQDLANSVELKAYELNFLSNDYLMHQENQQFDRWQSQYNSLSADISNMTAGNPDQQVLIHDIKTNQRQLNEIFSEVSGAANTSQTQSNSFNPDFVQTSSSRLGVPTQSMVSDASHLSQELNNEKDRLNQINLILITGLLAIAFVFLLTNYFLIYRRTLRSISNLQDGTKIIGSGNLDFSIEDKSNDEFGELSTAFNHMTAELKNITTSKKNLEKEITERKQIEEVLKESEAKYRNLFMNMAEEVHFWKLVRNEDGSIKTWKLVDLNPPGVKSFGKPLDEIEDNTTDEIFGPGATDHYMPVVQKIMTEGIPYSYEDYFPNIDKYFRFTSVPLGDYFITTGADITDIKKFQEELHTSNEELQSTTEELQVANEKLQSTTEELQVSNEELQNQQDELRDLIEKLEVSNRELEQFAYVASHDLQEPLRMVGSFTQLLERRYKDRLDDDADEFIGFIVEGANRMKDLIDDLLAFSRLNTEAKPFELINLDESVDEVLSYLKTSIDEREVEITREPLPTLMGDASQIRQLFQNLISNAIKFHGDEPPKIHISTEDLGDEWKMGVSDNGIGIDPEHQKKIFEIFKRLHTRQEYPGTGIGLAICKRIVERHGGQIWVESEEGKGSTFYFTIPKTDTDLRDQ